jgi:hypothetical protein
VHDLRFVKIAIPTARLAGALAIPDLGREHSHIASLAWNPSPVAATFCG